MAEQWWAIVEQATGDLVSVGTVVVDAELPATFAKVALAGQPDFRASRWNPATRAMEALPAPTDDDLVPAAKAQLDPSPAVGRKVLRDLAADAARDWMVLDALNKAVQADATSTAAQKSGAAALAQTSYNRAQKLAGKWWQAPAGS